MRTSRQLPATEAIRAAFRTVNALVNHPPNWTMAPTQPAMVVRRHPESGERHLDVLRWGLVPHFPKDLRAARKPIKARSETAASSGMFRRALAARRCLVPVDTFYEWKAMPDGKQPKTSSQCGTDEPGLAPCLERCKPKHKLRTVPAL